MYPTIKYTQFPLVSYVIITYPTITYIQFPLVLDVVPDVIIRQPTIKYTQFPLVLYVIISQQLNTLNFHSFYV